MLNENHSEKNTNCIYMSDTLIWYKIFSCKIVTLKIIWFSTKNGLLIGKHDKYQYNLLVDFGNK